jgi:prepilin-type N-terminal cleavage/methylation domain-containing protein
MRSVLRRRLRADDGFTLVELVMTVGIIGLIVIPLTGVVFSYLRNTVDTQARLTESHDVQFAAAYWQRDVASIGVRDTVYDTVNHSFPLVQSVGVAPCGLPAGATTVVTLAWSEYTSLTSTAPPQLVKVTYASRPAGGVYQLIRVRCGSQGSTVELADNLTVAPTASCHKADGTAIGCNGSGANVPALVKLPLSVHDTTSNLNTYTATLSGKRRQT